MFRADLLSIIWSPNTVFTAIGICHTGYVDCLLARSGWNSWWWTVTLPETCTVLYQNKVEKWRILLAFIIRIYHDARSSECQNISQHSKYTRCVEIIGGFCKTIFSQILNRNTWCYYHLKEECLQFHSDFKRIRCAPQVWHGRCPGDTPILYKSITKC